MFGVMGEAHTRRDLWVHKESIGAFCVRYTNIPGVQDGGRERDGHRNKADRGLAKGCVASQQVTLIVDYEL
jgi:hypothetical protein